MIFPTFNIENKYLLRQENLKDSENLLKYYSDERVNQHILSMVPKNLEEAKNEILYWSTLYRDGLGIYWGIATKEEDKLIGSLGFHKWDKTHNKMELSYDLAYEYWNQGIMTKAIQIITDFAFQKLKINRIESLVSPDNKNSCHLMKKLSFQKEGLMKQFRYFNGKYHDLIMFTLLRPTL